jgi:hypothetical protein
MLAGLRLYQVWSRGLFLTAVIDPMGAGWIGFEGFQVLSENVTPERKYAG